MNSPERNKKLERNKETALSGKYTAYPEYKYSGVEWLGDIPKIWKAVYLKYLSDSIGTGGTPKDSLSFTTSNDGIPWFSPSDFIGDLKISYAGKSLKESSITKGDAKIYEGNSVLVIGIGATLGKVAYCEREFSCNQQINIIQPNNKITYKFLAYALSVQVKQMKQFSNASTIGIMNQEKTGLTQLALPSKQEQTQIANFLDYETAKIDTLFDKQQQLIQLLKEKRQAVISHAVTKGLNPDAAMKDSGVGWLGEVPEHWDCTLLKYYARIVDCKHITAEFFDEGIPLASIGEVKEWEVNLSTAKFTNEKYYLDLIGGGRKPQVGDIIYSRNATVGEAALVSKNMPVFAMGQDVCLIRLGEECVSEYILYVLKSGVIRQQLDLAMVGSTFKRINVDDIRNFSIALPSSDEQVKIVKELERVLSKFDVLLSKAELTIELITERRTVLISAAVTGKIDVRHFTSEDRNV